MAFEWAFVGIAIIAEVIAALALRFSLGFSKPWPALLALGAFASAFYAVSLALVSLPVSVVYPVWAGGGTAGVAFFGVVALHEKYNIWKGLGVLMVVAGIVVLNVASTGHSV